MFKENINKINTAISGERMLDRIKEITCYHRIQASEGYRAAAVHCNNILQNDGIQSEILYYPASYEQRYLTMKVFKEWKCRQAYCKLVVPNKEIIADYSEDNLSVIQKSYPCDYSKEPIDIVLLDRGSDKDKYKDIDLKGKIIFVRDNFNSYLDWAIKEKGAIGMITDHVVEVQGGPSRYDLIDVKKYNTFWWTSDDNDIKPFGFVLSPREGDRIADLCLKMRLENEVDGSKAAYPQVNCFIDSEFYDGTIENVSATLAGVSSEEILITAHLCHPRSSANDNASGVTAAMETLKVLSNLIERGELPPLKRTIRILLIPEFTGVYAYLDSIGEERNKIMAGINLDMCGGKQEKGYGPLTLSGLPRSTPSFVMDLASLILDQLKKEVPGFSPGSMVPMFNSTTVEFTGGSDNFILSDPTIGIPTPMLGQWPDMYYHTSGDTPDVISTHILSKSATLAASYAYTLANLSLEDIPFIFGKAYVRMKEDLYQLEDRVLRGELSSSKLADEVFHYSSYYIKACEDYQRFFSGEELIAVKKKIDLETDRIKRSADDMLSHFKNMHIDIPLVKSNPLDSKYMYIASRKYISPINNLAEYTVDSKVLQEALEEYNKNYSVLFSDSYYAELLIQYYIDGKRTTAEIAENVIMDCRNGDIEAVHQYIQLLIKMNLVALEKILKV